jgi:hypothetical protein
MLWQLDGAGDGAIDDGRESVCGARRITIVSRGRGLIEPDRAALHAGRQTGDVLDGGDTNTNNASTAWAIHRRPHRLNAGPASTQRQPGRQRAIPNAITSQIASTTGQTGGLREPLHHHQKAIFSGINRAARLDRRACGHAEKRLRLGLLHSTILMLLQKST